MSEAVFIADLSDWDKFGEHKSLILPFLEIKFESAMGASEKIAEEKYPAIRSY
jgi:hypothetical protein